MTLEHLIEIENKIQLAYVLKERVWIQQVRELMKAADQTKKHTKHLYKQMNGFKVRELIVVCINTHAKKETCVATVDDLVITEL